jgi:hypothetical protein
MLALAEELQNISLACSPTTDGSSAGGQVFGQLFFQGLLDHRFQLLLQHGSKPRPNLLLRRVRLLL